jgi:hypothetical protein
MGLRLSELLNKLFFVVAAAKETAEQTLEGMTQARGPRVWV